LTFWHEGKHPSPTGHNEITGHYYLVNESAESELRKALVYIITTICSYYDDVVVK